MKRQVNVLIPRKLRDAFKKACRRARMSMSEVVETCLRQLGDISIADDIEGGMKNCRFSLDAELCDRFTGNLGAHIRLIMRFELGSYAHVLTKERIADVKSDRQKMDAKEKNRLKIDRARRDRDRDMAARFAKGETLNSLATEYGMTRSGVSRAISRHTLTATRKNAILHRTETSP